MLVSTTIGPAALGRGVAAGLLQPVLCMNSQKGTHILPTRPHWALVVTTSFNVPGRAALLIYSPLPASPYPTHTLACSCLLGPSLV